MTKNRNIAAGILLSLCLLVTACGSSNPFTGTWKGSCDFTSLMVEYMVADNPSLEEYVNFEALELDIYFEFDEDHITLSVDEGSMETFAENLKNGVIAMKDAMIEDYAKENEIDTEDVYVMMQMDRETYMNETIESMGIDEMVKGLAETFEVSGTYKYDDEVIYILHEDYTYDEMKYVFKGKTLTITISDGEEGYDFLCERQ